jgi:tRNA pseudouridine13 synthase
VDADCITGNAFDIMVRDLNPEDIRCYRRSKDVVRVQGVPNYFDDQRFGALRHGQGFVVKEMIAGELESALKRILLYPSPFDPPREAAFKGRLRRAWGDFEECVKLCRGGKHISVFEHLAKRPTDFAGAFRFVSQRIRLIHLYSYQSYLWNLCVSEYLRVKLPLEHQIFLPTDMGALVAYARLDPPLDTELLTRTFPLLAPDTKVDDRAMARAVDAVLEREGLTLARLAVPGVEGFAFKTEERPLVVTPRHWRAIRSEPDDVNPGAEKLRLRFELPRGSYATLVVKRLFASTLDKPAAPVELSKSGQPRYRKPLGMGIRESGDLPDSMRPKDERGRQERSERPRGRFGPKSDSGLTRPGRFDRGGARPRRGGTGGFRGGSSRFPRRGGPRRGGPR